MTKGKPLPSEFVTAEDLLKKLRAGTKDVHEIQMRELTIPVRVLSIDEINSIRRDAISKAQRSGGDDTDKNVMVQKLTLKLASAISKDVPLLSDKLLAALTVDEVNYLYEEYIRVMDSVNPTLEQIEPEVFRGLVEALKKNSVSSRDLSLSQLRAICTAFVELIQRLETLESRPAN